MDHANAPIAGGLGSKRSYRDETGASAESSPSKHPRTQSSDSHFIDSLTLSLTGKNTFPRLNFSRCNSDKQEILVVTTRKLEYHEPAGYLSRLRLIVGNDQAYKIQVIILTINLLTSKQPCMSVPDTEFVHVFNPGTSENNRGRRNQLH